MAVAAVIVGGQTAAGVAVGLAVDSLGTQLVNTDGQRASYSAAVTNLAGVTGDVLQLIGSASKTVRLSSVRISGTNTAGSNPDVALIKRSTADAAPGALALRASTRTSASGTAASRAITVPSTVVAGDLMIMAVGTDNATNSDAAVTGGGWTLGARSGVSNNGFGRPTTVVWWWKYAVLGDISSTVTVTGTALMLIMLEAWSSVDPTTAVNASALAVGGTNTVTFTPTAVTTTVANCRIVEMYFAMDSNAGDTLAITAPATIDIASFMESSTQMVVAASSQAQVAAGVSGTPTATGTGFNAGQSGGWIVLTVAVAPGVTPVTTTPAVVAHDSSDAAGTAVATTYTVASPTLGTAVGTISVRKLPMPAATTAGASRLVEEWIFAQPGLKRPVLRGVAEALCINLPSAPAGTLLDIEISWTEE